ncbi:MAG: molybdopterin oxidoreductase family protein, partial [Cetobacterium sp.]
KLELFVVQDLYDDTDSSLLADLYLPVVSGLKKDGTIINTERRVSRIRPVLKKGEGEKTDFEVIYEVGKALGMGSLLEGWETPEKVFNKMMKTTEDSPCDMTGIDYKILDEGYGIQWPFKKGQVLEENERRLFEDNVYYTPNKKVKFIFEDVMENPKPTNQEYPYILDTGRGTVGQWHTQTRTREINYVADVVSELPYIYISKDLGNEKDIKAEDEIFVESINGRVSKFKVLLTEDLSKNVIFCPLHYIEANNLTLSIYDTYSKEPSYKYTPVKIIKA